MTEAGPGTFDWETIFHGASWFHISGITPALSQSAADLSRHAVRVAKKAGVMVSCDYNYRSTLWKYGANAPDVMRELLRYSDVVIASKEDSELSLGMTAVHTAGDSPVTPGELQLDRHEALCRRMFEAFPNLKYQAMTLRELYSASRNGWSACLFNGQEFLVSTKYELTHIVDRIGGGDSFAAGLIYALATGMGDEQALNFAVAASALKHTIPGDMNLVTLAEVEHLVSGDTTGRVQR